MALAIILKSSGLSNITLTSSPYAIRQNTLDLGTEELLNSIPPSADTSVTLYERGVRAEARRTISMNAIVTGTSLANLDVQLNALRLRITNADSMTIQADGASAATTFNLEVGSSRCETIYSEEMRNALQTEVVLSLVTPPGDCWGRGAQQTVTKNGIKSFDDANGDNYGSFTIQGSVSTPIDELRLDAPVDRTGGPLWASVKTKDLSAASVYDFSGTTDATASGEAYFSASVAATSVQFASVSLAQWEENRRFRLLLRAYDAGTTTLKFKAQFIENDLTINGDYTTFPARAQWRILNLGSFLLPPTPRMATTNSWTAPVLRIIGKRSTTASAVGRADCLYVLPEDEGGLIYAEASNNLLASSGTVRVGPAQVFTGLNTYESAPKGSPLILTPGSTNRVSVVALTSNSQHRQWPSTTCVLRAYYTPRYLELSS